MSRILITAYACEPNKGSEPEVGWQWVKHYSRIYDEVVVVTRRNNAPSISLQLKKEHFENVTFLFFDLPSIFLSLKKKLGLLRIYAYFWEIGVFFFLLKKYRLKEFDVAQRVTFVSYHYPSFIWFFADKFVLGPIAGGERFPLNFLSIFNSYNRIKELLRLFVQYLSLADPLVLLTLLKADLILAVTPSTVNILPGWARKKAKISSPYFLEFIKISQQDIEGLKDIGANDKKLEVEDCCLKLLYVGSIREWKGIRLIFDALRRLSDISYQITLVGEGPDREFFQQYANRYNINARFCGYVPRQKLPEFYMNHHLFVFMSLHDSCGLVVLEAKSFGLPVIVSEYAGSSQYVDEAKGDIVVRGKTVEQIVASLETAIRRVYSEKIRVYKDNSYLGCPD